MKTVLDRINVLVSDLKSKGLETSMIVIGQKEAKKLLEECKKWYPNAKNIHGWEYYGYKVLVHDEPSYLGIVIGEKK